MPAYISSIGVAVPQNKVSQDKISDFMMNALNSTEEQRRSLKILHRASGIKYRHSVIADYGLLPSEFEFYPKNQELLPFPDLQSRMMLYESEAIKLAKEAVSNCFRKTSITPDRITHLITVSCTGMYAPGLDIDLVAQLNLNTDVERTSINFMGCYAAFNALKIAKSITENQPLANVLVVCVELCSIHFQNTNDEDNLLSSALFADGAAATLVGSKKSGNLNLELKSFYSDLDMSAKSEMSWKIGNLGFLMKLSPNVPETIRKGIKKLTSRLLKRINLNLESIDFYAIHPGGKRILEVIEEELNISKTDNKHAYEVLKNYGNMSSPTVLFVLKSLSGELERTHDQKSILSFAFGPGLTLESLLLKIHTN